MITLVFSGRIFRVCAYTEINYFLLCITFISYAMCYMQIGFLSANRNVEV